MSEPTITRADVKRLSDAQQPIIEEAKRVLDEAWTKTRILAPEQQRDLMIQLTTSIVHKFGAADSTAARVWLADVRKRFFFDDFDPQVWTFNKADDERLEQAVRAKASWLWTDQPDKFLDELTRLIDRNVHVHGQLTVASNVARDKSGVRWARVPTGGETCAWCLMQASRGFVFRSHDSASFHAHANDRCEVVPEFRKGTTRVSGFDPDKLADAWSEAAQAVEDGTVQTEASGKLNQTLAVLRQLHPELLDD